MLKRFLFLPLWTLVLLSITNCDDDSPGLPVVFFSVQDDIDLGRQVSGEIAADPNFNLLERSQYPEAYAYLDNMVNSILNSGEVKYRDEFVWDIHIVHDDNTLNAFATPGGFIYVYTGLIKFLNDADALAGVMGHEIAHADLRHTSRNLQKQYGVSLLLSLLLGEDPGTLETIAAQIAGQTAGLQFSRDFEKESDAESVEYLAGTDYACDGAKIFFQKLENTGQGGSTPEFLSTHPSPENRIADIEAKAREENCDTTPSTNTGYADFVKALP